MTDSKEPATNPLPPPSHKPTEKLQGVDLATLCQAVAQSAEAVMVSDTDGVIHYVNAAFERISGYTAAEAVGQRPSFLRSGRHDAAFYRQMWEVLQRGETWHGVLINKRKDGTLYHEQGSISPVYDAHGMLVHYVAVKRDITRELELEQQFLQSQKMEAVGRLAGSVAHDFNNLLTAITGFASLALMNLPEDNPTRRDINQILAASRRAGDLTKKLLTFSRRQVSQSRFLNLNDVMMEMGHLLHSLLGASVELVLLPGENLGLIKADPAQIAQVILNLAVNAKDAMPKGGKLTIATANVDVPEHKSEGPGRGTTVPYVRLTARDTGQGMSADTKAHLFEPFFTTKEKGKGTGLGLATVYGIVKQAGGSITVISELGEGAEFAVLLPRVEGKLEAAVAAPEIEAEKPAAATETILLAEDESTLRELGARILKQHKYHVLEAGNGEEALRVAGKHHGPINLLLTDVMMPIMGGLELAVEMRVARPSIKVLFVSGYTDDLFMSSPDLREGTFFLQKPFAPSALLAKVRQALDAPAEPHQTA